MSILFLDNFNRANSTTLGNGWSQLGANKPAINSNSAYNLTDWGWAWRSLPTGEVSGVSAKCWIASGGWGTTLALGDSEMVDWGMGTHYALDYTPTSLSITRWIEGEGTLLAYSYEAAHKISTAQRVIGLNASPTHISATVAGIQVFNVADTAIDRAWITHSAILVENARLDDFTIHGADAPEPSLNAFVNAGGAWKPATELYVNDGGVWKPASAIQVNDGGWK